MRIVCQKCSAAYAIDDKFVTARGVRAQCPRCRHLQLVKKDEAGAQPAVTAAAAVGVASGPGHDATAPGGPSPFLFDLPPPGGAPAAASAGGVAGASAAPFNFGPAPTAAVGDQLEVTRPGGPGHAPFDFSQLPPAPAGGASSFQLDFVQPPPASAGPPAPPPPFPGVPPPPPPPASPFDFGSTGLQPRPPSGSYDAAPGTAGSSDLKCRSCGKPLTDPFDQALGTCDECRAKSQPRADGSTDSSSGRIERVNTAAIAHGLARSAGLEPTTEPAAILAPPPTQTPNPVPSAEEIRIVRSALRAREQEGRGRVIAAVVAIVLVLGAVGGVLVYKRGWTRRAPPRVVKPTGTPRPIELVVQQWRLNYPELEGEAPKNAAAHLEAGEQHLLRDTTQGYVDAQDEFQRALVLDPGSDRAVGGWVLSLALGSAGTLDEALGKSAEGMLEAAEQRSGDPRLYVAHAHLLLARSANTNDVQVMAERGRNSSNASDKALAALAIGQSLLAKNPQLAETSFREAINLDPKLKRAYIFQAQLSSSLGRYKDAIDSLEKRLSMDPDQWEAAQELARTYVDVGELQKAKKTLENARTAAPHNARPKLSLAMLSYQHLGEVPQAIEQLNALVADRDLPKLDLADGWTHLAAAHRVAGNIQQASDAVGRALELLPEHLPARFQHLLVSLDKGVNSEARLELDALKGKLGDPALETALEARMLTAEGRFDEAVAMLLKLWDSDAKRPDALMLAGGAAARARRDGKAWELCLRQGLKADPGSNPVPPMTGMFYRPADLLKPAVGAYSALVKGTEEDPNPEFCEALVAWYSEDWVKAELHFGKVNAIDPRNADAYAFRALLMLRHKDPSGALKQAQRGVDANHNSALAHFAAASAYLALNKPDQAKAEAASSQRFGPTLLGTRVVLGDIEARQKNPEEAKKLLTGVLLADPRYRDAKRVLYKHSL